MDNYALFKEKLSSRKNVKGTQVFFFNEPMLIWEINKTGSDFLVFDMEHGRLNTEMLAPHLQVCRLLKLPSIVRVQDTAYHLIAKTMDMGADGIMLPRTETLAQLETAVNAMFFHPVGKKGYGGLMQFRENESFGEYQNNRFLLPQIESPKGVEALPAMLESYGDVISGIIIGPYDMSCMVETPQDIRSGAVLDAIRRTVGICADHGKSVGIYCNNAADAADYLKMGANIFWMGTDRGFYVEGLTQEFQALDRLIS